MDEITPGLTGEASTLVVPELTAEAIGSGRLPVYGTPAMIALMEAAALNAIEHLLPEDQASVGIELQVSHLAATPVGEEVRVLAEVTHVLGRRVEFVMTVWDEREVVGEGTHARFVIDIERFMERVQKQANDPA